MEVKIISGFGENVFQMPEENVWNVLREAAEQTKRGQDAGGNDTQQSRSQSEAKGSEQEASEESIREYVEKQKRSRVDNLFGSAWRKQKEPDYIEVAEPYEHKDSDEEEGYTGFLLIKCEKCGKIKGFCAKKEVVSYRCECGHETHLENLRPLYLRCKCGADYRYKTNLQTSVHTQNCLHCGSPVDIKLNNRKTAYVTIGGGVTNRGNSRYKSKYGASISW